MIPYSSELLPIDQIVVQRDQRQRREIETADLEASIGRIGLISPIVVNRREDGTPVLLAGERRLQACRNLGLKEIPVRWFENLPPIEQQIVELEENVKRKDLSWKELVDATEKIHSLYLSLDPDWTEAQTGEALSLTQGTISLYLRVAGEIDHPRVATAGTVREAYNVLARRDAREAGNAIEELLGTHEPRAKAPFAPSVLEANFLSWVKTYSGPKFNLIHCDFPYGINFASGPQGKGSEPREGYGDSPRIYTDLLEGFCQGLEQIMSLSGHLLFWYSGRMEETTRRIFSSLAPSLVFSPFPLIWVKSDNTGIASDPRHGPRHIYETCLLASRGNRQIVRVVADAYSSPSDQRLHPSAKPEPMLRHFFSMLVDEFTDLLDPTCGAGSSLRAADSLGARTILGIEVDPLHAKVAEQQLSNARQLRVMSKREL